MSDIEITRASGAAVEDVAIQVEDGYLFLQNVTLSGVDYGIYTFGDAELYSIDLTATAKTGGHTDSLLFFAGDSTVTLSTYALDGLSDTGVGIFASGNAMVELSDVASTIDNMSEGIYAFGKARVNLVSAPVMTGNTVDYETPVNTYGLYGSLIHDRDLQITTTTPVEYVSDGAITKMSHTAVLTKGSVGAYTLAGPSTTEEGMTITITSKTAHAHVVTATNLIHDGVTGGAKDTMTFAAFLGASITLRAVGLFWHVIANNNVAVAG